MELATYKKEQIEAIVEVEENIAATKELGIKLFQHLPDGSQIDITEQDLARQERGLASMRRALRFIEEQIAKAGK